MARNDRERKRSPRDLNRRPGKKKVCIFCKDRIQWVDYKDVNLLKRYQSDRGKIRARRVSGNCTQHQREVAIAIKTARELALLPYAQRTVLERSGGRGGRSAPMRERRDAPEAVAAVDEAVLDDAVLDDGVLSDGVSSDDGLEAGQELSGFEGSPVLAVDTEEL